VILRLSFNVRALANVQPPPTPLKVILPFIVAPPVFTVFPVVVELNVICDSETFAQIIELLITILPEIANIGGEPVNVQVDPVTVKLRQVNEPDIVTVVAVALFAVSKITLSAAVGTDAPVVAALMV